MKGQPSEELIEPRESAPSALHKLWLSKKVGDELPRKSDFKPTEMKKYLSCIYLVDILDDAADFRIRLFGTDVVRMLGRDYTGAVLSETATELNWRGEIYNLAYQRREPLFYLFNLGPFGREYILTENALFPQLNSAGELAHLLCISVRTSQK